MPAFMPHSVGIEATLVKPYLPEPDGSMPTGGMVEIGMPYRDDLKALHILRQNVRNLLTRRGESESELAVHLGFKHRSSLNKFLKSDRAGFQMTRLDKMAAFFGLPVYQLFQPGISPLLERRGGKDRRAGQERRVGHSHRLMMKVGEHVETIRPRRSRERASDNA